LILPRLNMSKKLSRKNSKPEVKVNLSKLRNKQQLKKSWGKSFSSAK